MEQWSKRINFADLARQYGTPLYVFNEQQFHDNITAYLQFTTEPHHLVYPVKANPSLAVLKCLAERQCAADCASAAEVYLAQQAGIPLEHIVYNTPCPDYDLVRFLLTNQASVVVDSLEFLSRLASGLRADAMTGKLMLRINPSLPAEQNQPILAHGAASSKFGIAPDALLALPAMPLPIHGLHAHVGSRMALFNPFIDLMKRLHDLAAYLKAHYHQPIETLDLGGGLGIPYNQTLAYPTLDEWVSTLRPLCQSQYHYLIEPGNSLVGDTMGLITQVKALKTLRDRRWAIVDVGCDQLINPIALRTPHQMLNSRHEPLPFEGPDAIGGPLCFAGDVLLENTDLSGIAEGDYLLIQHTGAYCYALGNHFNGRYFGGMVSIRPDGRIRVSHAPEKFILDSNNTTYIPQTLGERLDKAWHVIQSLPNFTVYAGGEHRYRVESKAVYSPESDWQTHLPALFSIAKTMLGQEWADIHGDWVLHHARYNQWDKARPGLNHLNFYLDVSPSILQANHAPVVHIKWVEPHLGIEGEWVVQRGQV